MRLASFTLCQIVLLIACFSLGQQVVLVEKTESQESEQDQDVGYRLSSSDSNNYKVDEQSVIDYDKKFDIKAYDEIDNNMYEYKPPKKHKQKVMHKHKKTGPRKQQHQGRKAHRPYDGNIVSNLTKKKMSRKKKKHKFRKALPSRKPVDIIVHIKMKE